MTSSTETTAGVGSMPQPDPGPLGRSRRDVIVATLGSLAGFVAAMLGRPETAHGAAGDPLVLGQANSSGNAQTTLSNAGPGAAFTLKTTNVAGGATGMFGWTSQTGSNATRGVYGRADGPNSYGIYGVSSAGLAGNGAAIYASGGSNVAVDAQVASSDRVAILARNTSPSSGSNASPAVRGVTAGAAEDIVSTFETYPGGGEFAGPSGVVGVAVSGDGNGAAGLTAGSAGIGVYGLASHASGSNLGVLGETRSTNGIGVYGISQFAVGVSGWSDSGFGVRAESTTGTGLKTSSQVLALEVEGRTLLNGVTDVVETVEPASPSGAARLFARDADGLTQLCVKLPDGSVVVIASELV